jgi:hypothetical protein
MRRGMFQPVIASVKRELRVRRAATTVSIACVTVVAVSALASAVPALRQRWGYASAVPVYAVGDRIDLPATIYGASPLTLLIFSRAGCGACQTAKSALTRLLARLQEQPAVGALMLVREGSESAEREYLREIGLDDRRLIAVNFAALRVGRVPTLVLVNRRGEVQYSLEGIPTAIEQEALIRVAASLDTGR